MISCFRFASFLLVLSLCTALTGCHFRPAYSKVTEDRYPYEFWMRVPIATESVAYDSIVFDFYISDSPLDSGGPSIYVDQIKLLWRVEKKLNAKVTGEMQYEVVKIKLGRLSDGLKQIYPDPAQKLKRPKLGSGALIYRIVCKSKQGTYILPLASRIDSGLLGYRGRVYIPEEAYEEVDWVHENW